MLRGLVCAPTGWTSTARMLGLRKRRRKALIPVVFCVMVFVAVFSVAYPVASISGASTYSWPQVQNNPQHTGFTTESIGTNFNVAWTHPFQPERVFPQVQPIVYKGAVFVGTESGHLYSFGATSGSVLWKFPASGAVGPIITSSAAADGLVFVSSMDGAVYAVNATTGQQVWKTSVSTRYGFSADPTLDDNTNPGKILVGNRNGTFYALNPASGTIIWQTPVGSPIVQTAAYDNGRVFFGALDMRIRAINTADGTLAWQSAVLHGTAFKDFWPVVTQGLVIDRTQADTMGGGGIPVSDYSSSSQETALNAYDANPSNYSKTLYVFRESSGAEMPGVIHWNDMVTIDGTTAAPCVDASGFLVIPAQKPANLPNSWQAGWARLNLTTRMIVAGLTDSTNPNLGYGNIDENVSPTCTANGVLVFHSEEANAQITGFYDFGSSHWTQISEGRTNNQMSNNTQGGGSNPASVANGWVYHISWHELIARTSL